MSEETASRVEELHGVYIVTPPPEFDVYMVDWLAEVHRAVFDRPRHVVIDLSGVERIGSRGLGAIIRLNRELADVAQLLRMASPSEAAAEVLEISNLDRIIPVYETVDEAVAELSHK